MRFDLSTLGPREFENLTQTLALAELGPGISIFGLGPDGGREATFDGPVSLNKGGDTWNGYGVLQAKYCETLNGSRKDADWFISQCKTELKKWSTSTKRDRGPDYIIFATNVVLSGVARNGGVDRVAAELDRQCKSLGIKAWQVWHFDTICRLLEKHPGIRTSYAAWILPGDILNELLASVSRRASDVSDALRRYLAKELLRDRHVNLDQAGSADDRNISLADVFIDLPVGYQGEHYSPHNDLALKQIINSCDTRFPKRESRHGEVPRGRTSNRFVLVGGPGQGKTTVGQFLCQIYRARMLEGTKSADHPDVSSCITQILRQAELEGLKPRSRRWPVRIALTQLADEMAANRCTSVLQFVSARVTNVANIEVSAADLQNWLRTFPWILLLDGLDEVPATSNRDQVIRAIDEFLMDVAELDADVIVVATTRPQGYTEEFSPKRFSHIELKPLERDLALHYADKLAVARYGAESSRISRLMERLERAAAEASTARLMTTPLQVTIMAVLLERMGKAPKDRYNLFNDYYRVIYERELEKEGVSTNLLRDHRSEIGAIHADVGLLLQMRSERSGDTESRISLEEFSEIIGRRLETEGHQSDDLKSLCDSISKAATDRLVFLVASRAGEVGFEIRSLQEFWAAAAIMTAEDQRVRDRLEAIAAGSHWRNVLLFAFGKIFAERTHLRDSAMSVVAELNVSTTTIENSPETRLLLGSRLAVDILVDGLAKAPKYEAVLIDQALKLLSIPASNDLERLALALTDSGSRICGSIVEAWLHDHRVANQSVVTFLAARVSAGDVQAYNLLKVIYDEAGPTMRSEVLSRAIEYNSEMLLEMSSRHFLGLSIAGMMRVVTRSGQVFLHSNPSDVSAGPRWLSQFIGTILIREAGPERFNVLRIGGVEVTLTCRKLDQESRWYEFETASIPGGHWITLVREFVLAPTTENLGRAVEALAAAEPMGSLQFSHVLPWPISSVLIDFVEGALTAADIYDARRVGSIDSWRQIEDGWRSEFNFSDLGCRFSESISSGASYFPMLSGVGLIEDPRRPSSVEIADATVDACRSIECWDDGVARVQAIRLVMICLHFSLMRRTVPLDPQVTQFLLKETAKDQEVSDLIWLRNIAAPSGTIIAALDEIVSTEASRWMLLMDPPRWLVDAWINDLSRAGIGSLVCSVSGLTFTRAQKQRLKRAWLDAELENPTPLQDAVLGLSVTRFLPITSQADFDRRLEILITAIREGHLRAYDVIDSVHLMHKPLQRLFLLALIDALADVLAPSTREYAFDRLVADRANVSIDRALFGNS